MKHGAIKPPSDPEAKIARLEQQLERERLARREAEAIAETGLRDLYSRQQELALLQRITDSANASTDVHTALQFAIEQICDHMHWDFGNAFLVEDHGASVHACDVWYSGQCQTDIAPFIETSRTISFERGLGMPGLVIETGREVWFDDVRVASNFQRSTTARKCGLSSAFAFPIIAGEEVVAVLEFFSFNMLTRNDQLLALLGQIGTQLGRVVERDRSRSLLHDVQHDPLTGLPNRVMLAEEAGEAFGRLDETKQGLAIFVLDLDGFKAINDRCGHHAGDELLIGVADRLRATLAKWRSDMPNAGAHCRCVIARTGGDEFVVVLEGERRRSSASIVAKLIHQCLEPTFIVGGETVSVAVSIGIAQSSAEYECFAQLQRDADLAMYEAKAGGRSQTVTFTTELGTIARNRRQLDQELNAGVTAEQFIPHYQPIQSLDEGGAICGFEALARWQHPTKGLVNPHAFLELAEETGLIVAIGDQIMRKSCEMIGRLQRKSGAKVDLFVSVNIAAEQFLQSDFVSKLRTVIEETGIDPRGLRLEVTESVAIRDIERTREVISEVREWGIHTSLDDFGTGYSSLSYVQKLPFDSLKIDRSVIRSLEEPKCLDIVTTILGMSQQIGLQVVAEGIEQEGQRDKLRTLGCQFGQGYLFGRPKPEAEALSAANIQLGCDPWLDRKAG